MGATRQCLGSIRFRALLSIKAPQNPWKTLFYNLSIYCLLGMIIQTSKHLKPTPPPFGAKPVLLKTAPLSSSFQRQGRSAMRWAIGAAHTTSTCRNVARIRLCHCVKQRNGVGGHFSCEVDVCRRRKTVKIIENMLKQLHDVHEHEHGRVNMNME